MPEEGVKIEIPPPPKVLQTPGKELWYEVCQYLIKIECFDKMALVWVEQYCSDWDTLCKCNQQLAEFGLWIDDARGSLKKHPAHMMRSQAVDRMLKVSQEYGFTPLAKVKMGMKAPKIPNKRSKKISLR